MKSPPLQRDILFPRIDGMTKEIAILKRMSQKSWKDFSKTDFGLASWHLHHILEGIINVSSHILSRIPGSRRDVTRYKDMVRTLGVIGIVPKKFAEEVLTKMMDYRNRLVHGYSDITKREIYNLLQNHLKDCEIFLRYIKRIVDHPKKFGLTIE